MEIRKCVICGNEFSPKSKTQQCCSTECAKKKSIETRKKKYKCQHCGQLFWRPDAFRMKYCSPECRKEARREQAISKEKPLPTVYKRECAYCGKPFETTFKNKIYCGKDCCNEANKRSKREQWADRYIPKTVICKECGIEFITECGDKHSVFCCKGCADKYERRMEHSTARHKAYMNTMKSRREKQLVERFVEEVSYDELYKRDHGVCQVCGLPVVYDKLADDNWSGTIDHIEPLSVGGEHSMNNCQLAHRICNSLKCRSGSGYRVDWEEKAKEDNYWNAKYQHYLSIMQAGSGPMNLRAG